MAAGGAILFASKGLFAKVLYSEGVDFQTLTTLRALISLPLFALLALGRGPIIRGRPPRAIALAALAGVLCYGIGALVDFWALMLIDVSTERALLFSYPALVVAWTAFQKRRWPKPAVTVAIVLTYVGILAVVGGFDGEAWRQNLTGSLMVLFCAGTTASYWVLGERCLPDLGSRAFTIIAMGAAAVAVVLNFLITHPLGVVATLSGRAWFLLLCLAILCMFVPTLMQAEGMRRIGAVRGALSATVGPPAAMGLGAVLLGERPGALQIVGTAMIVAGVLVIAWPERRT